MVRAKYATRVPKNAKNRSQLRAIFCVLCLTARGRLLDELE